MGDGQVSLVVAGAGFGLSEPNEDVSQGGDSPMEAVLK